MSTKMPTMSNLPSRAMLEKAMRAVVQVVALRQGFLGSYSPAWTGSGTIVDPSGIVVTNCHVANPRAMGMSAPPADRLGIAITERSDQPPVLTYFAQVVAQSPELDLAVLRIVSTLDGKALSNPRLPAVPLGDSDELELGDAMAILGYPGIGGETITLTMGTVSGFSREAALKAARAWIKTDATIAGGNSGGCAVNSDGELVGVPTQAAAGSGVTPVDARPVVDTNRDGRIDERDTPMAIGGFINGLRPVNLAKAVLQQAGIRVAGSQAVAGASAQVAPVFPAPGSPGGGFGQPSFSTLVFSSQVSKDGRPINPAALLPAGGQQLFATFDYSGMNNDLMWGQAWAVDGKTILQREDRWEGGTRGRRTLALNNSAGLPNGDYHLVLTIGRQVVAEGSVVIGKKAEDTDSQVSGQIVDARTRRGIAGALVIALRPGVRTQDFVAQQKREMAYTSARTDANGRFALEQQLPKGQAYGLVVVAKKYEDLAIDSALRVGASAPENVQLDAIPLQPE